MHDDVRAEQPDRGHLGFGGTLGHDDGRGRSVQARGIRDGLSVVSRGSGDKARGEVRGGQGRGERQAAANLERPGGLGVLVFDDHLAAGERIEGRVGPRRGDGQPVVDCVGRSLDVVEGRRSETHGAGHPMSVDRRCLCGPIRRCPQRVSAAR